MTASTAHLNETRATAKAPATSLADPGEMITLDPAQGSAVGTDQDDVFVTPDGNPKYFSQMDWSQFKLQGGAGSDTLILAGVDDYDLRKFAQVTGIERIAFREQGGSLYLTAAHLAGLDEVAGGDAQSLIYLTGNALATFDLRGKSFLNNYQFMTPSPYADIVIGDKSQLLDAGEARMDISVQAGTRIHLAGGTFTEAERALLIHRGATFVRDDNDIGAGNKAPEIVGLNGDQAHVRNRDGVYLDTGNNAVVTDDVRVRKVTVAVVNPSANDWVDIARDSLDLPNGISEGGRIRDATIFNAKVFANLYNVTNASFDILFNGEATPDYVNKVVRSLAYVNDGSAAQTQRQVRITVSDGADKAATSVVTVTHSAEVRTPPSGGSVTGSAESSVFKGSAKNDRIYGGGGNDTIYGGAGNDILRGDAGNDVFVFDSKLSKMNVDRLLAYSVKDDRIWLDNKIFTKLGKGSIEKPVKLAAKAFWAGDKAHDADDRIIYNKMTGALSYDQDGSGAKAAIQFAIVSKGLQMASEFWVV